MDQQPDETRGGARGRRSRGHDRSSTPGAEAAPPTRTPVTQQIGRVVVVLLLVVFGVFAATNAQPVDFSWVFGGTEVVEGPGDATEGGVPLIVLLLASFAVGALVGAGLVWQGGRNRRRGREDADEGSEEGRG